MKKRKFPYKNKTEFYKNVDKTPHRPISNAYDLNRVGGFRKK